MSVKEILDSISQKDQVWLLLGPNMDLYIKLFEVLFPVFFIIGIGYFIGKKDKKIDTKFITNFAANIGSPAMIIYALNVKNIS